MPIFFKKNFQIRNEKEGNREKGHVLRGILLLFFFLETNGIAFLISVGDAMAETIWPGGGGGNEQRRILTSIHCVIVTSRHLSHMGQRASSLSHPPSILSSQCETMHTLMGLRRSS